MGKLSGPGLAMYLVAFAHCGWTDPEFWINSAHFRDQFGLSETTRKKGLADLVDPGRRVEVLSGRSILDATASKGHKLTSDKASGFTVRPLARPGPELSGGAREATPTETPLAARL